MAVDYNSFKVVELKELVKERGIAATGLKLKQHFVDALLADDAEKSHQNDEEQKPDLEAEPDAAPVAAEQDPPAAEEAVPTQLLASAKEPTPSETPIPLKEALPKDEPIGGEGSTPLKEPIPAEETTSSDAENRKRKRRSPTPPVSAESVSKKLKTAEDNPVKLPEDTMEDLSASVAPTAGDSTVEPQPHDDVEMSAPPAETIRAHTAPTAPDEKVNPSQATDVIGERRSADVAMADSEPAVAPAKHPATSALYIRELVRPLQPSMLRDHLASIASPPNSPPDPSIIQAVHLSKLRTHALVRFDSIEAATRARSVLHDRIWPDEPMRKPLWVDFVPADKVQGWIDTEMGRMDTTRWEVIYTSPEPGSHGEVVAELHEVGAHAPPARRPSGTAPPSAPLRPEDSGPDVARRPSSHTPLPPPSTEPADSHPLAPTPTPAPAQSKSFDSLDSRYSFTQTKPKLYFQPVARALADRRQAEFDHETARDWDQRAADPAAYAEGELRRYTFEADRIVDGGADFGLFGRRPRAGGRAGGLVGGGARSGRRPGESYRGRGFRR